MSTYNAFTKNNIATLPVSHKNVWRWNNNFFINPSDYQREVIPAYFDAPYPNKEFIVNGPVAPKDIQVIDAQYNLKNSNMDSQPCLFLNPGGYSYLANNKRFPSSEHIRQIWPNDNVSLTPLEKINFKQQIEIATYGWSPDSSCIVIKNRYNYSPDSDLSDVNKKEWKLVNGIITMGHIPLTNIIATIFPSATDDTYQLYFLPEFPAHNITITGLTAEDYIIDNLNGIIYIPISLNLTKIEITYDSTPLVTFVPASSILDYVKLDFDPLEDDNYFITISPSVNHSINSTIPSITPATEYYNVTFYSYNPLGI